MSRLYAGYHRNIKVAHTSLSCVGHAFRGVICTHNNASAPSRILSHELFFSFASFKKNESAIDAGGDHLCRVYSILMEIHLLLLHTASILSLVCLRSFFPFYSLSLSSSLSSFFLFHCSFAYSSSSMSFVDFVFLLQNFYFAPVLL